MLSVKFSLALNKRASSSVRTVIFYTPPSSDSPGYKKKVLSPVLNSFVPHLLADAFSSKGFNTIQYYLAERVVL